MDFLKITRPFVWVIALVVYLLIAGPTPPSLPGWLSGLAASRANAATPDGDLSVQQLRRLAADAGCDNPQVAAAVAFAESSGRPDVAGDGGQSIGLWQIHLPSHPQYSRSQLRSPRANARAACSIASRGRGWNNWTTYRTGAYRRYLSIGGG